MYSEDGMERQKIIMQIIDSLIERTMSTGEISTIYRCKTKKLPYMLRIIVFCAVKTGKQRERDRNKEREEIDDQTRKFNLSEAVSL